MVFFEGVLEVNRQKPRVDLGGFETGVAEHLLDVADVGAVFEHADGGGVAQEMRPDFGVFADSSDYINKHVIAQSSSLVT